MAPHCRINNSAEAPALPHPDGIPSDPFEPNCKDLMEPIPTRIRHRIERDPQQQGSHRKQRDPELTTLSCTRAHPATTGECNNETPQVEADPHAGWDSQVEADPHAG